MTSDPFSSESALTEFLKAFEEGTYPIKQWTHESHIIMAAGYLSQLSEEAATPVIREGIKHFNLSQGGQNTNTSGYHETLTIFWIRIVAAFLETLPETLSRLDKVRACANKFGPLSGLFRDYWSYDLLQSTEARKEWRAPDLKALP